MLEALGSVPTTEQFMASLGKKLATPSQSISRAWWCVPVITRGKTRIAVQDSLGGKTQDYSKNN
jgi:hypothetical protein